jgi:hypothetical protein
MRQVRRVCQTGFSQKRSPSLALVQRRQPPSPSSAYRDTPVGLPDNLENLYHPSPPGPLERSGVSFRRIE